jgi:hypothetical protein
MKYINKLALMALAVLGFSLQAAEPEANTAAMGDTESQGWSLPTKVGLGTLGAGAAGAGLYGLGKAAQLYNAQRGYDAALQAANDVRRGYYGYDTAKANYDAALQNLQNVEGSMPSMPTFQGMKDYLGNAKDSVVNWWNPQPTEPEYTFLAERALANKVRNFFGTPAGTPSMPEFASSFNYQAPVSPWYMPSYGKVGAALAGAALLGGGLYGANRLYQRYRGGSMPAVEALAETMTDEQIAQNLQNQEILNILLTMADLINGEGVGMKASDNTDRLARLHSYINALNAANFATTELTSMGNNLEAEFKAAHARDFSAIGKRDKRNKITGMYRSLSNLLSDHIRNLRK